MPPPRGTSAARPCTFADRKVPALALVTFPANDGEGNDDAVSLPKRAVYPGSNFHHLTHHFVTHNVAWQNCRNEVVIEMQVRAADRAARHLDDDVARVLDSGSVTSSQRMSSFPCQTAKPALACLISVGPVRGVMRATSAAFLQASNWLSGVQPRGSIHVSGWMQGHCRLHSNSRAMPLGPYWPAWLSHW